MQESTRASVLSDLKGEEKGKDSGEIVKEVKSKSLSLLIDLLLMKTAAF